MFKQYMSVVDFILTSRDMAAPRSPDRTGRTCTPSILLVLEITSTLGSSVDDRPPMTLKNVGKCNRKGIPETMPIKELYASHKNLYAREMNRKF